MERMEVRIPRVLSMLPESEKGTFSKAIASSAKLRVAVLERRLREGRAMLRKFEDEYGKTYPDFERDFPDNADIQTHEDLVEWAFWDRAARDCSAAIEGYKLLTGH